MDSKSIKKEYFLGLAVSTFTMEEYYLFVNQILANEGTYILYGYTLLLMPAIKKNPELINYCNNFDLLVTDGRGFYLLAKLFGLPLKFDFSIPNMVYSLLEIADKKGYSVLVFGGSEIANKKAVKNLRSEYPNAKILEGIDGYYRNEEEDKIIKKIASEKPDILLVANSSPKKEFFVYHNKEKINAKIIVPCGGMVDVFAGDISLTPKWLKKSGCAWLYRFFQEPIKRFKTTYSVFFMGLKILGYYIMNKDKKGFETKNILEVI